MKLLVLDAHNDDYEEIAALTRPTKHAYCQRHGYDFVEYRFGPLGRQWPGWGRLLGLQKHLPDYDWVFYCDTDILLMNGDIALTSLLDGISEKVNFIIGPLAHEGHLSSAAMFLRNCPWSFRFLDDWWQQVQFDTEPYEMSGKFHPQMAGPSFRDRCFEQSAMQFLLDNRDYCQDGSVEVRPRREFNSLSCERFPESMWYRPGDLLVHCCGGPKATKMPELRKLSLLSNCR